MGTYDEMDASEIEANNDAIGAAGTCQEGA